MNIAQKIFVSLDYASTADHCNSVRRRRTRCESSRFHASRSNPLGPGDSGQQSTSVLFGDPSKPGLYGVMTKWLAGNHFSRPHVHPNDRYITVLSGT